MSDRQHTLQEIIDVLKVLKPDTPIQVTTQTIREGEGTADTGEHLLVITVSYEALEDRYSQLRTAAIAAKTLGKFLGYAPTLLPEAV